ncbi:hypothetical protein [Serratia plymuthica]|uniref:hypothetical protein n=1 Tax=Serratia plymuthica TaxID=82996 RepID=UPI0019267693|nr:hypothetical protein [Serratia plymuthica]
MALTIKELQHIADTDHVQCGDASALARELLSYRDENSVFRVDMDSDFIKHIQKCSEEVAKWPEWKRQGADVIQFATPPVLNSPETPDGWVMVPKEPTESMIIDGFESEPDKYFSDKAEWKAYKEMSGCQQAAHRAKLCWDAMLAAAPKPEK